MNLKQQIINKSWYFGKYWGRFVPEPLVPIMDEIRDAFFKLKDDEKFLADLNDLYKNYIGRPSPLIYAKNLTEKLWGAKIFLKNEWTNHTWAHKINHCVWQALLAKYLWKKRVIAETGAGQHWLATSAICAKLWLECVIYMGKKDYDRQRPNVYMMELAWARVIPVMEWNMTLRDAVNSALKDLLNNSSDSYYLLWTACWPNPYPSMNVFFQKIIGEEVREQIQKVGNVGQYSLQKEITPDYLIACVGGWSNSQWLFYEFLDDENVKLIWVEAGWEWIIKWKHAARFQQKQVWVVEWYKSFFLQNKDGQVQETSSISAWLDYSWVSPQLTYLEEIWRVEMKYAKDDEVLEAVKMLMKTEGILPALESAHALVEAIKLAPKLDKDKIVVVWISGRWDKDLFITAPKLDKKFVPFLKDYIKKYD